MARAEDLSRCKHAQEEDERPGLKSKSCISLIQRTCVGEDRAADE